MRSVFASQTLEASTKRAMISIVRRWRAVDAEVREMQLHNAERLQREASFAALCGSSPVKASSGKTRRYRLNRGGDRAANSALWAIVRTRMVSHQPTKDYVARRTAEGLSKQEIMRCLKRYVARQLFPVIVEITRPEIPPSELERAA